MSEEGVGERAVGANTPSYTRLTGRWLALARTIWLVVAAATLGLFASSLAPGYTMLRKVCVEKPCGPEQLSPEGARSIAQLGLPMEWYAAYNVALIVVFAVAFSGIAVVIFVRRSDDLVALYTSLTLVLAGVFLPDWMGLLVPVYPLLWLPLDLLNSTTYCALFILFYLFPNGRFVPRWTRWPAVVWVVLQALHYVTPDSFITPDNWPPVLYAAVIVPLIGTCLYAQIYRYLRVSGTIERQQTKWVVFGLTAMLGILVLATVPPEIVPSLAQPGTLYDLSADLVSFCALMLVPVTFGIAILRSRLFDVDVIINRVIAYGSLTISLAVVYLSVVVLLQYAFRMLTGQNSSIAIVASTLAIAALFNPLRHRIQEFINKRFYRKKYDAAITLAAFSVKLRDETDLEQLNADLQSVVRETMQPEYVGLWLREPGRRVK